MLLLRLRLLRIVTRQTRDRTADGAANAVRDALAQIVDLAGGFLGLALCNSHQHMIPHINREDLVR